MASQVIVALRVKASASRAFEVFTGQIGAWWKPNGMFTFTPRSPGVLSFEGHERLIETLANGKVFEIGKVRVWEPGRRLVFGWRQATFDVGQDTEVEVVFEPAGEETRVSVTHTGWDSVPAEHVARHSWPNAIFMRRHGEWWQTLLASYREQI